MALIKKKKSGGHRERRASRLNAGETFELIFHFQWNQTGSLYWNVYRMGIFIFELEKQFAKYLQYAKIIHNTERAQRPQRLRLEIRFLVSAFVAFPYCDVLKVDRR